MPLPEPLQHAGLRQLFAARQSKSVVILLRQDFGEKCHGCLKTGKGFHGYVVFEWRLAMRHNLLA